MRPFLLAVSFVVFATTSVTLAVMLAVPEIPELLGFARDEAVIVWQALATIVVAVLTVFAALYAGGLLWLFLACHVFTRDEIERFVTAGPNTRLEIWVLERFSR